MAFKCILFEDELFLINGLINRFVSVLTYLLMRTLILQASLPTLFSLGNQSEINLIKKISLKTICEKK